jgi:AraC-like DNA-binding protein
VRDPRELSGAWSAFQEHGSAPPGPALAGVVSRYWWVRWDLREQPPYRQLLPPTPAVHLTFPSDGEPQLRGVHRRHFHRVLSGAGGVLGVAFVPGTFRRFLDGPVSALTDRTVPAATVFGPDLPTAGRDAVDAFLTARVPADPAGDEVAAWVRRASTIPDLCRVDDLAGLCGVGVRRLQRLFAEHVGVSPKWLLRRFRLQEVTDTLAAAPGAPVDWAGLAADLGYVDQAHLSRDFAAMFGEPPTRYAARY